MSIKDLFQPNNFSTYANGTTTNSSKVLGNLSVYGNLSSSQFISVGTAAIMSGNSPLLILFHL